LQYPIFLPHHYLLWLALDRFRRAQINC
jgi:uncharacterized protein (DUF3820 family)